MSQDAAQFVFMTCRPGAETALKQEVARAEPAWRLAFSRPGFLTFKVPEARPANDRQLAERRWTFAHAHGASLGRVAGSQLKDLVEEVWRIQSVDRLASSSSLADVHVWEPAGLVESNGAAMSAAPLCNEIEIALRAVAPNPCDKVQRIPTGPCRPTPRNRGVLDVIVVEPGQWWIGYHRAVTLPQRWPGGVLPVSLPAYAVSRAYAKLEEALQWSGLPLAAGDECVEIGCAPGGASQALLDRGLFVTGIDPAEVDAAVLSHPRFRHLKKRGKDVRRHEFLGVRWLLADMNIAPDATLDEVEAIVSHRDVAFRGMILTLKMSDWQLAEQLPEYVRRVRGWGYRDVHVRQLVTGGQEVCLVALRRKALRRVGWKLSRKRTQRGYHGTVTRQDAPHATPPEPHF
jgi:23S rRNA (cytidine2498-2'-O)-methyltransferase